MLFFFWGGGAGGGLAFNFLNFLRSQTFFFTICSVKQDKSWLHGVQSCFSACSSVERWTVETKGYDKLTPCFTKAKSNTGKMIAPLLYRPYMTSQKGAQAHWGSNVALPRALSPCMQPEDQPLHAIPPGWPGPAH